MIKIFEGYIGRAETERQLPLIKGSKGRPRRTKVIGKGTKSNMRKTNFDF